MSHTPSQYLAPCLWCLAAAGCTTYAPPGYNASGYAQLSGEIHLGRPAQPGRRATRRAKPQGPATSERASSRPLPRRPRAPLVLHDVVEPEPSRGPEGAEQLHARCKKKGRVSFARRAPKGAAVFFHNTQDANGDGRNNDWYTGLGKVVGHDGPTLLLQIQGGKKVRLNLDQPDVHTKNGKTLNTALRAVRPEDPAYTQYLAGQLFAGFCEL